jgi:hypothetical protein
VEALEPRLLLAADVVVNEIMYQATSHSEGDEWIELYNRGNSSADLTDWKITKGVDFSFNGGSLGAGKYLVVAANLAQFQAKYPGVTNVVGGWTGRLSNSGEEAQIEDGGGNVVDKISYADSGDWAVRRRGPNDHNHMGWVWVQPASGEGATLELINPALSNNNGENWAASTVLQGTPGAVNSVYKSNVAPLILNVAQSPIVPKSTDPVSITADFLDELGSAQSAQLHWRVDGSGDFTVATMVDNGTGGDAVAEDGTWTAVIPPQADKAIIEFYVSASDGTLSRTWPAPTDSSGTQGANALYQVDDTVYSGNFAFYRIIMTEAERAELAYIGVHGGDDLTDAKMNATFISSDTTGSQIRYEVGVRNRGHGSRIGTPNNYHLDFPADNLWKGEKATNFNARSPYNQVMGSAIWSEAGFAVPNEVPVQMRINGSSASGSGGQYSLLEEPDSVFTKTHFPDDSNGNFYGAFRLDENLSLEAELQYLGTDPNSYREYYPKQTNSELDDYSDIIHLTDVLNNTPTGQLYTEAQKVINLNEWLRYIALDNLLLNRETGLVRGIGDDYNLYRGELDQRFLLVPHDLDTILGTGGGKIDQSIFAIIQGVPGETNGGSAEGVTGLKRLLQLPEVLPLYYQAYLDLIKNLFNPTVMNPLIDQVVGGFASPTQISSMKSFVVNRAAAVLAQIPQNFIVNSSLSAVGGYLHTTDPGASFDGSANASITKSVMVNGIPAIYNARTGAWSISTSTTTIGGSSSVSLIGPSAVWKYKDDGSDQGTGWIANGYNDSQWASGPAQLGYSEGQENDEATLVNGGPEGDHFITTYFRRTFNISNKASITGLNLSLLVDDGAEVYLNGQLLPIVSYNMPGAFDYSTEASSASLPENVFVNFQIDPSKLVDGTNYLAVEVHQAAASSSDVSFDLRLDGVIGGSHQPTAVLPKKSTWSYLDDGSNQGTAWATVGFNDSAWATGDGILGRGNSNQTTTLNGNPGHVTNYFRRTFTITDVSEITGLTLHLMRDDGAAIWINGVLAATSNMPGTWDYSIVASANVAGGSESNYNDLTVSAAALATLHNGANVIAVEVHDSSNSVNNDVSFDLSMDASVVLPSGDVVVTGGVPLHPGVNRVEVQAFDGFNGTGNVVNSSFVDVWYEGTNNGSFTPSVPVDSLTMTVPDSYRPGTPILVQVQAIHNGDIQRDLWDGTVTLSSNRPDVTFSSNQVVLKNGWGSVMVTPTGAGTASGSFTLSATLGDDMVSKSIASLNGAAMTNVSGTLAGGAVSWSGIVHVTGNVTVPAGTTLTIQPGTEVLVDGVTSGTGGFTITANGGAIRSLGTADHPVVITAIDPTKDWGGLALVNAQASLFQYTQISRAGNTTAMGHTGTGPALRSSNTALTLDHSTITDNVGKAGDLSGGSLTLLYSEISRSRSGPEISGMSLLYDHSWIFDNRGPDDADGIYLHDQSAGQTITLEHGMIGAVDDDDVDTLGSVVLIDDMILRDAKDKGVSVLDGTVTINNSLIAGNSLASEDATFSSVSAKNLSNGTVATVNIDHTTIIANDPAGQGRDVGIEARNKYGLSNGTINYNVTNSIIVATKPVNIESPYLASTIHISYSDTFGMNWGGTGNLNVDPMFVNPASHDYHPRAGAPEINAGDPAAANNDSDGTRSDQGFYRNGAAGATPGSRSLSGTVVSNTILRPEDGPFTVTGILTVPAGVTLTILPGTSIYFAQNAGINVNGGRIVANGTEHEQIRFTHTPSSAGATWAGIQINSSNLDNQISYAVLEYGVTDNGMIGVSSSRATLDHLYFDKTDRRRLRFNNASIILTNSEFADIFPGATAPTTDNLSEDVWGSGILAGGEGRFENNIFGTTKGHNDIMDIDTAGVSGQSYIVRNNIFKGGGDDALDIEGDILIEGNTFSNFIKDQYNTGVGNSNILSAGLGHNYTMVRNTIINSEHAAQVKENSFLTFVNNTVVGGPTNTAAIYFLRPGQPGSWGKGAYIDGNIFKDKPIIVTDYTNTTQITINRSIVPVAYFGFGTGNTSEDARFVDQASGDFALRPGSPAIGSGPNGVDMGALVPAGVSISGEPASVVGKSTATLIVGGGGVTAYKYRLNNGAYGAETPIGTPINLSGLTSGTYTVYVIGKNAAGEWQSESDATASRTWTVDTSAPSVRVNEVLASNKTVLSNGGQFPDLIELYNHGDNVVDLSGMSITDTTGTPRKFVFPAGTTIAPGAYLVLYADSKSVSGQIHTGFSLKNDGEGVYLYNTTGAGGGLIDGVTFGAQLDDYSIGRTADGSWVLDQPTFGSVNVAARTGDTSTLKVNEWLAAGVAPFTDDFVEIYNPDPLPVAVGGFYLSDDPIPRPGKSQIPELSFISGKMGAGGYGYFVADSNPENGALHTNFKIAEERGMIGLFDPNQKKVDEVLYLTQRLGQSEGRSPDGGNEFAFYTQPNPGLPNPGEATSSLPLRITEINYNPPAGEGTAISSDFEFIEFKNTGSSEINLNGVQLAGEVNFTFGDVTVQPGQYVVIVRDPTDFTLRYGTGISIAGVFSDELNDNGGQLRLLDSNGATVLDFGYSDIWQPSSDGAGDTLVVVDPNAAASSWGSAANWRASRAVLGTPGIDEAANLAPPAVVINEMLAHSAGNAADWIELRNTTGAAIDLSGWYLSNDAADMLKYKLPSGTILPANGYLVFNQASSFGAAGAAHPFSLNGDGGEVYLSSATSPGILGGYRQGVTFGASDVGVSQGRFTTSTGEVDFVALASATAGAANSYARVGPVVISEIQYHPAGSASEFIELHNTSNQVVPLYDPANPSATWKFTNGIDYTFEPNTSLAPGAYLLVVSIDPAVFRQLYDIPDSVQVVGVYQGSLDNSGEKIELSRPGVSESGAATQPYVVADWVKYGTAAPWVTSPDGNGPSLARKAQTLYGNDPTSWVADNGSNNGSPGTGNQSAAPTVAGSQVYVEGNRISFVFSTDVSASLNASDLVLLNLTTGQTLPAASFTLSYDSATNTATWTSSSMLPDGNYKATLLAAGINDATVRKLDGNGDGQGGDNYTLNFFMLAGDANRDRTVSFADLVAVAQHYGNTGKSWIDGDFNGDGIIGFADLVAVAQRYGTSLAEASAPVPSLPVSLPADDAPSLPAAPMVDNTEPSVPVSSSAPAPDATPGSVAPVNVTKPVAVAPPAVSKTKVAAVASAPASAPVAATAISAPVTSSAPPEPATIATVVKPTKPEELSVTKAESVELPAETAPAPQQKPVFSTRRVAFSK